MRGLGAAVPNRCSKAPSLSCISATLLTHPAGIEKAKPFVRGPRCNAWKIDDPIWNRPLAATVCDGVLLHPITFSDRTAMVGGLQLKIRYTGRTADKTMETGCAERDSDHDCSGE